MVRLLGLNWCVGVNCYIIGLSWLLSVFSEFMNVFVRLMVLVSLCCSMIVLGVLSENMNLFGICFV